MSAAALAAAAAFNLVCSGNETIANDFKNRAPFTVILRVNLEARRWCDQKCDETRPIRIVTTTAIVFADDKDGRDPTLEMVNRESGSYVFRLQDPKVGMLMFRSGRCERADFTGFPVRKF